MVTYKLAVSSDSVLLARLRIDFLEDFLGPHDLSIKVQLTSELEGYFRDAVHKGEYISFIALENELIAGAGGMVIRRQPGHFKNPSGKVGYLMNMFTYPKYRRRGICSAIVKLLTEEGKKAGISAFELHATKDGEKVYPELGFYKHNEPTYRLFIEK